MKLSKYEEFVMEGIEPGLSGKDIVLLGAIGLAGETGEVCDHLKKVIFHGNSPDRDHLVKELGDVMWYLTVIARTNEISLEEVLQKNIVKLCGRYPRRHGDLDDYFENNY